MHASLLACMHGWMSACMYVDVYMGTSALLLIKAAEVLDVYRYVVV